MDKKDTLALIRELKRIADALEKSNELNNNILKVEKKKLNEINSHKNNQSINSTNVDKNKD